MSAAALNTINSARERRIRTERCKLVLQEYDPAETVTVQEMKEYANCVNFLYPAPSNPQDIIFFKLLLIGALLFTAGGAIYGWRNAKYDKMLEVVGSGFLGLCLYLLLCSLVVAGVFLFTA